MVYRWRSGAPFVADAQRIGEHLESLRVSHARLTPRLVVDDAKSYGSPLHELFEWRDDVASDRWRRHQARQLLGALVVVAIDDRDDTPTRAFVVVREPAPNATTYVPIAVVLGDPALLEQVLARALRELRAFERKYSTLTALADAVRRVRETFERA